MNTMVGFDDHLIRIMDKLTGDRSHRQIIPIVGMGGIGKTTLAKNVFDHQYIVNHFHFRAWFTISQEYSVREILLELLSEIGIIGGRDDDLSELGTRLYQSLSGRKYLIVMDDMWSTEAWDDLALFFPDDGVGSRILVTTRLTKVAVSLGNCNSYLMDFLDEEKSWNLLCEKAFPQGSRSPELEEIGKKIARSCRGLPLAIVVIGGLLGNSNMTREYWEFIAENVISYANSENDEHCLKILALSYKHLPIHLKTCFLYMRVFPEDTEIRVSKLIKLWIAEGFLKPSKAKYLEEVAEEYLKDLIDRNLILIRKMGRTRKIKTCGIHDLLRDLCMRESHKEHLFCVPKVQDSIYFKGENVCFLCCQRVAEEMIHLSQVHLDSGSTSLFSSFVCNACRIMYPQLIRLRLVRVCSSITSYEEYFLQHTKLRYFSLSWIDKFVSPSPIPLLWSLQSLIIDSPDVHSIVLPSEIWEMPQLRHIIINHCLLPRSVATHIERKGLTILENLQTLSTVGQLRCTVNFLERIPNLKELRIHYAFSSSYYSRNSLAGGSLVCSKQVKWSYYSLNNLGHLHKLESLSLVSPKFVLKNIAFPYSVKKLSLSGCKIPWEDMTIIGSLPNLEMLKLRDHAFTGPEWNPVEGEFLRLKGLSIYHNPFVHWNAENIHFPSLETLELCWASMEKIPWGIGDIATLRLIRLFRCDHLIPSAKEILEEQQSFGNEPLLQVHVTSKRRSFRL